MYALTAAERARAAFSDSPCTLLRGGLQSQRLITFHNVRTQSGRGPPSLHRSGLGRAALASPLRVLARANGFT